MDNIKCANCGTDNKPNVRYCTNCGHELPKTKQEASYSPKVQQSAKSTTTITKPNNSSRNKKIVGFATAIIVYISIQLLFFSKPSFDKIMMQAASEINKTCPVMIDAETRLDNSIALPNNTFQYNYTLVKVDRSMIDTIEFKGLLEPGIVNQVKTNPQMKAWVDNKVVINYLYKDKNGMYICIIQLTPDKYE